MNLSRPGAVLIAGIVIAAATACSPGQSQAQDQYCTDQYGQVYDPDYCDPTESEYNPGYFIWLDSGHHSYRPGHKVPRSSFSRGTQAKPSSSVSRNSGSSTRPRSNGSVSRPQSGSSRQGSSGGSSRGSSGRR